MEWLPSVFEKGEPIPNTSEIKIKYESKTNTMCKIFLKEDWPALSSKTLFEIDLDEHCFISESGEIKVIFFIDKNQMISAKAC